MKRKSPAYPQSLSQETTFKSILFFFFILILVTFKILNNTNRRYLNVSNFYLAYCLPEMKDEDFINFYNHSLFSPTSSSLQYFMYNFLFIFMFILTTLNNTLMPQFLM